MKRLYLIRHAKSSWKDTLLSDFDRPLNKRGLRDAPFMGQRLHEHHVHPDIFVSSPAKRAIHTSQLLAQEVGFPQEQILIDESIYEAGVMSLLQVVHTLDDRANHAILVGHNPGMTMFAQSLARVPIDNMPTCSIFCVEFDSSSWKDVKMGNGVFVFFDSPQKTSAMAGSWRAE